MDVAAISIIIDEVKQNLFGGEYVSDRTGVLKKLEEFTEKINTVKTYLDQAASRLQVEHLREMDLERQLKEVVYDVLDTIESSLCRRAVAMARNKCFRQLLIKQLDEALERSLDSIGSRKLDPIINRIKAYKDLGIQQTQSTETNQNPSKPPPPPKNFVGLKDEAESLISSLMIETERLDIIAVTGMHGVGKTTLASMIYHDSRIREVFPTLIWVPFRPLKELCFDIIKQCNYSDSRKAYISRSLGIFLNDESRVVEVVRDSLKKSKYLLVVDGVWKGDEWESVARMFPEKGKVLITSCDNRIYCTKPHMLRFLTEKESWELLQREVFGELGKCPEMLKHTGECIARDCDGLPVAIAAAGNSLLVSSSTEAANNLTNKWWEAVSENVTMYVTDYGSQHRVLELVELSYARLPPRMLECFLYLGVFPEGHEICVRTLVRLWIAEGLFIRTRRSEILEETADSDLQDLVDINLVMVVKRYPDGQIRTCRLHKLIHAFCKNKAADKDLYQEIKMSGDRPISLRPNTRRLCIYSHLSKFLSTKPKERRVRSILCFNEEGKVKSSRIYKRFNLLRVMEWRNVNFTRFPSKLNKLIHLRYISLSCDEILDIPKNITTLRYLETLVVHTKSSSLRLKANIWRMIHLRHLVTKAAIVVAPPREREVAEYLMTLTRLAPACCTMDVFRGAPNVKTLGIRGNLATLAEADSMQQLNQLENLKLINESAAVCQLRLDLFPCTLKRLTLSGTYLKWECISRLGCISSLKTLKLKNNAFTGGSWTSTSADGFGSLTFLLIETTDLDSWEASDDCFPKLKHLVLNNCEKLQKVPSSLAKSLDILDVENIPETVAESARVIRDEIVRRQGQDTSSRLHEF